MLCLLAGAKGGAYLGFWLIAVNRGVPRLAAEGALVAQAACLRIACYGVHQELADCPEVVYLIRP